MFMYNSIFLLKDTAILQLLIAVNILIGISGTLCNALVCNFYKKKRENVAHFLYFMLSSVDMACGLIPLLHAVLLILVLKIPDDETSGDGWRPPRSVRVGWGPENQGMGTEEDTGLKILLPILYFLTSLTARVSVFLSTMIAVVRTLNITLPTYRTNKKLVVFALMFCVVWWLVFLSGDMIYYKTQLDKSPLTFLFMFNFYLTVPTPGHYFTEKIFQGMGIPLFSESLGIYSFLLYTGIPFVLPTLVCILCMCIQIWHLATKGLQNGNNQQFKKDITITILLLTSVFTICNVLYVTVVFAKRVSGIYTGSEYLEYSLKNMLPYVNSLLNPIILIIRGSSLRTFVKNKIQNITRCRYCRGDSRVNLQPSYPTVISTRL